MAGWSINLASLFLAHPSSTSTDSAAITDHGWSRTVSCHTTSTQSAGCVVICLSVARPGSQPFVQRGSACAQGGLGSCITPRHAAFQPFRAVGALALAACQVPAHAPRALTEAPSLPPRLLFRLVPSLPLSFLLQPFRQCYCYLASHSHNTLSNQMLP